MKRAVGISLLIFSVLVIALIAYGLNEPRNRKVTTGSDAIIEAQRQLENINKSTQTVTDSNNTTVNTKTPTPTEKTYSLKDVSAHKIASDCWMIIDNSVYDVSSFIANDLHPAGSDTVIPSCGTDATATFNDKHSGGALSKLSKYIKGKYAPI